MLIKYFRRKRKQEELAESYILVTFRNELSKRVVVRSEDNGFDYIRTIVMEAGEAVTEKLKKGAYICIWEATKIVGEYTIKKELDDNIEIVIT